MLGEKAAWELHKDIACSFEQILEAAPYQTAALWLLSSHLANKGYYFEQILDLVSLFNGISIFVYYLKQILEAAPFKTIIVQPLTFHLSKHPHKTGKTFLYIFVIII